MSPHNHDELDDEAAPAQDEWEEFRGDDLEPIGIEELKRLNLKEMPEDVSVWLMDNYFPRHRSHGLDIELGFQRQLGRERPGQLYERCSSQCSVVCRGILRRLRGVDGDAVQRHRVSLDC